MFSIYVLLYGDHRRLAARCLKSIIDSADWSLLGELCIGLNAVTPATRALAVAVAEGLPISCHIYEEVSRRNIWKYPMMRRMLWDAERPVRANYVMWFDDDSYVRGDKHWWRQLHAMTRDGQLDMLGSRYSLRGYRQGQADWIKVQPWYTGKPIRARPVFFTGGWWLARWHALRQWDYPFSVLQHNGGDSILGELAHQQDWRVQHFNQGIAINADEQGRESKAKRRGDSTPWPGEGYTGTPSAVPQQDFMVTTTHYWKKYPHASIR